MFGKGLKREGMERTIPTRAEGPENDAVPFEATDTFEEIRNHDGLEMIAITREIAHEHFGTREPGLYG